MKLKQIIAIIIGIPNNILNKISLKRKHVIYDKNLMINGRLHIHGFGQIIIGENCIINSNENSNPTAGGASTHLGTGNSGKLIIGNRVGISNCAITAKGKVEIEDDVLIGSNCMIADTDFHSLTASERGLRNESGVICKPIVIKKHAFIGARSIILKGTTIGENSIIGAGSVVTKNVPDNEIWAGNPAKFIKKI